MATCNDCFHYEACKKIFQIAFKDFTDYTFVEACELYKPTADVVEVVRCKDCKHYKRHKPPIEDFDGWCSANEIECDTDFYCQYGSMKGGE